MKGFGFFDVTNVLFDNKIINSLSFSGMHVFHLQGEVHQQLHRDSRISHPARNRSRTTHGSQFLGLLEEKKPWKEKKKEDKAQKTEIF